MEEIPVVDIFAGPGGLGEGFSSFSPDREHRPFQVRLSIEKEFWARQTLRLRSFFRHLHRFEDRNLYYQVLRGQVPLNALPDRLKEYPDLLEKWQAADLEAMQAELGAAAQSAEVGTRIARAVARARPHWVLIGGPPCQAYSIVGRVRNRGNAHYRIEKDQRSSLYREYLQILANHWPSVFIMENVKGILSTTIQNQRLFDRIIQDLQSPLVAIGKSARASRSKRYRIVPLVPPERSLLQNSWRPSDFVVPCEQYGIPQVRHRVILVGIREDLTESELPRLRPVQPPTVSEVILDLPPLRSGLSSRQSSLLQTPLRDSPDSWKRTLVDLIRQFERLGRRCWMVTSPNGALAPVRELMLEKVSNLRLPDCDRGAEFIRWTPGRKMNESLREWYVDDHLGGVCNHCTRGHMDTDLARYLFAACYASIHGVSPKLSEFPKFLQPNHLNAATGDFSDRFRVQVADKPATTVVSHLAKDGHYFIHPDPSQCRSLTVREAARLQTFPDNYYFCGPRTAQYVQVGNAVPPLIATQIAECVWTFLEAQKSKR